MLNNGMGIADVMAHLDHQSPEMTLRYAEIDDDKLKQKFKALVLSGQAVGGAALKALKEQLERRVRKKAASACRRSISSIVFAPYPTTLNHTITRDWLYDPFSSILRMSHPGQARSSKRPGGKPLYTE